MSTPRGMRPFTQATKEVQSSEADGMVTLFCWLVAGSSLGNVPGRSEAVSETVFVTGFVVSETVFWTLPVAWETGPPRFEVTLLRDILYSKRKEKKVEEGGKWVRGCVKGFQDI